MTSSEGRLNKHPYFSFFVFVAVLALVVIFIAIPYYSQTVTYVSAQKYYLTSEQMNEIVLQNRSGRVITVQMEADHRNILIDRQKFQVAKDTQREDRYTVYYPDGKERIVEKKSGMLFPLDENGEIAWEDTYEIHVSGDVSRQQDKQYLPSTLVRLAYEPTFEKQGSPGLLFLSMLALVNGWCLFFYEKYQLIMFYLSFKWIWTNDHEPSDFYYFTAKLGGIVSFICGVLLFFYSFI